MDRCMRQILSGNELFGPEGSVSFSAYSYDSHELSVLTRLPAELFRLETPSANIPYTRAQCIETGADIKAVCSKPLEIIRPVTPCMNCRTP